MEVADCEDRPDRLAHALVLGHVRRDHRAVRAQLQGLEHRHGRADAEGAGHVAGRDDDAASAGMADDQRLAGELRPVALLDGGIEGIAIDVGDAEALDLRMGEEPRAAAPAARLGRAVDDLAAIPAQRARHGSRSILVAHSRRHAPELPPPCGTDDAYYVSRARHAGRWPPALQVGLAPNHLKTATQRRLRQGLPPRGRVAASLRRGRTASAGGWDGDCVA